MSVSQAVLYVERRVWNGSLRVRVLGLRSAAPVQVLAPMSTRLLRNQSIERKVELLAALACAVGVGVAAFAYLFGEWIDLRNQARKEAQTKLEFVAGILSSALESGDSATATNILAGLRSNPQSVGLSGYVTEGGMIGTLAGGQVQVGGSRELAHQVHVDRGTVFLYRPVTGPGNQVSVICLQAQIQPVHWRLALSFLPVLAVFGLSLAAALWFSARMRRSISEPIQTLWRTARVVCEGEGGPVASGTGDQDELNKLVERIGEVVSGIQRREAAVVKSQSELESRVAERTRELQQEIQQRIRVEASLADEKERLSVTLRSMGDGVVATDFRGSIVLFNAAAEELTGWPSSEAVGRHLRQVLRCVHVETREPMDHLVEDALRAGESAGLAGGVLLTSRDGTERMVELSCAPICDSAGKSIGVVLVLRDVTEKQRQVESLLTSSKLQSIGMMAGGIAHDFNNILTSVLGHVSMAKRNPSAQGELLEHLSSAEESALRARDITRQLLTFAKGGLPVKKTIQVSSLIGEMTEFALRGSNVRSHMTIVEDLWPVDVDEGQFSQVIQNIALRAVRAMPGGGTLELRAANVTLGENSCIPLPPGNYVLISMEDGGESIRPEDVPKVFDPYFIRDGGGGLGLAAAYAIVQRHGGHIAVSPRTGKGTTFHIYLPAKTGDTLPTQHDSGSPGVMPRRILLMDDDEAIRRIASAMLESVGYEVVAVEEGGAAIERYCAARSAGRRFDAVILDLTVRGGKGGKETIQELLRLDSDVKAIVSSGYSEDGVLARYSEYGFAAAVPKPYNFEELESILRKLLEHPASRSSRTSNLCDKAD